MDEDTEILNAFVLGDNHEAYHQPAVQVQIDYRSQPVWCALQNMDRVCELFVSEEEFNPIQPDSDFIQKDRLPRPIHGDNWLQFPFPSVMLPLNKLRIGDTVLATLSFTGDFSVQGVIKAGPGDVFGAGPNRMPILSHQVELQIAWVNEEHRSIRLPDDFTFPGVEFVGDLYKRASWLFPWMAVSYVLLEGIYIPVLASSSLRRHFKPLMNLSP
jgi:hypothetical protein